MIGIGGKIVIRPNDEVGCPPWMEKLLQGTRDFRNITVCHFSEQVWIGVRGVVEKRMVEVQGVSFFFGVRYLHLKIVER
jgi:hypothetical protein